jgi:hypothetical protein
MKTEKTRMKKLEVGSWKRGAMPRAARRPQRAAPDRERARVFRGTRNTIRETQVLQQGFCGENPNCTKVSIVPLIPIGNPETVRRSKRKEGGDCIPNPAANGFPRDCYSLSRNAGQDACPTGEASIQVDPSGSNRITAEAGHESGGLSMEDGGGEGSGRHGDNTWVTHG